MRRVDAITFIIGTVIKLVRRVIQTAGCRVRRQARVHVVLGLYLVIGGAATTCVHAGARPIEVVTLRVVRLLREHRLIELQRGKMLALRQHVLAKLL